MVNLLFYDTIVSNTSFTQLQKL